MSYLDSASLLMIPSGYKEDKVFCQLPEDGSGDLTFTRASDGTRVNSEGYVERVPWNLLQYSEQFDNAYWTKTNLSITANATTSPDGAQNADKLTENTATSQHALRKDLTVIAGTHTVSVFVKGTARFISIYPQTATNAVAVYDLANQLVTYTSGSDYVSSNIIAYGNDWFRLVLTCNTSANTFKLHFYLSDSSTSPAPIYTGNGTSGIYIWGAQLTEGSTAKPYIATTNRQDVPRLDYSNGCPCLLLEPQRTNLVDYSEYFDSSQWAQYVFGGASLTKTFGYESPQGNNNAYKFDVVVGTGGVLLTDNITINPANAQTLSVWMKGENGGEKVMLALRNTGSAGSSGDIITLTSEWVRYDVTLTTDAADRGFQFRMLSANGVVDQTIYVYGAQLEQGSYATSYIPTTSASVTRIADKAYKTGISSLIGQSEGTLFIDFIYKVGDQTRVSISDGSSVNWFFVGIPDSSTHCRVYIRTNGAVQIDTSSNLLGIFVAGQRYKIAVAYKSGDWAICVNGVIKTSGTQTFTPSASFNTIALTGNSPAPSNQIGLNQLFNASLYKTRLTNDQLADLTTL